jgi:pimeloyl-ACP methyl ester carboxylesterase
MTPSSTTEHTIDAEGARLHVESRGMGQTLLLVGSPMGASSFAPLAEQLATDYRVITLDPRGIGRSTLTGAPEQSTPEVRAADLAAILDHLAAGPAIVLGSSGGAVSALALAILRPDLVDILVAHEPPLATLLSDDETEHVRQSTQAMIDSYLAGDVVAAWEQFFSQAGIDAPPGMIAAMFGGEREAADVADERYWFEYELAASTFWEPDLARARASAVRVVPAIGEESAGQLCDRTTRALAVALETSPVLFPGDHTGFVDAPEAFAEQLRRSLPQA